MIDLLAAGAFMWMARAAVVLGCFWAAYAVLAFHPRARVALCRMVAVSLLALPLLAGAPLPPLLRFHAPPWTYAARAVPAPIRVPPKPRVPQEALPDASPVQAEAKNPVPASSSHGPAWRPVEIAVAAWGLGAFLLLGRWGLALQGSRRLARRAVPPPHEIVRLQASLAADLGLRDRVGLGVVEGLGSALLVGLRPVILLPAHLLQEDAIGDLRACLAHELGHIQKSDWAWSQWLRVVTAFLWPVIPVWFLRRAHDRAAEIVCDSIAAPLAGGTEIYAGALARQSLQALGHPRGLAALPMFRLSGVRQRAALLLSGSVPPGLSKAWLCMAGVGAFFLCDALSVIRIAAAEPAKPPAAAEDGLALPPDASKEQAAAYIRDVLKDVSPFTLSARNDRPVADLKKVGPDNIDVLLEADFNDHSFSGMQNPAKHYYISMAIAGLARPQDKKLILEALAKNRYLVYTVLKRGWAPDARDELLRVFHDEPGKFSPGWIEAIASLHDPTTYGDLKDYLIHGQFRDYTYNALKKISDIGDLRPTVEQAWPIAKNGPEYQARDMAKIAAGYGIEDAARYLAEHPEGKAKPAAAKTSETKLDPEQQWAMTGGRLTPDEAAALEQKVAAAPEDIESRAKLMGYYFLARTRHPGVKTDAKTHILWMIRHHPQMDIVGLPYARIDRRFDPENAYPEASQAWDEALAKWPADPQVIAHAAAFFLLNDPPRAEQLLLQGEKLEPSAASWKERLGQFYRLRAMRKGPAAADDFRQALAKYEAAAAGNEGVEHFLALPNLAQTAYDAEAFDRARDYAEEALRLEPSFSSTERGDAVYTGHSILGLLALRQGDLALAGKELLAAGGTPGSPVLGSFGPNMTLAAQLLAKGDRDTVIAFLEETKKFWKIEGQEQKISGWQEDIRQGRPVQLKEW